MNLRYLSAWSIKHPVVPLVLFVALTLADHNRAVHVERVERLAHGFYRGAICGFAVPFTTPNITGYCSILTCGSKMVNKICYPCHTPAKCWEKSSLAESSFALFKD